MARPVMLSLWLKQDLTVFIVKEELKAQFPNIESNMLKKQ